MLLHLKKETTWSTVNGVFILADVYNMSEEVKLYKHNSLVENTTAFSNTLIYEFLELYVLLANY